MKITVDEKSELLITECFSGVGFKTNSGEEFSICMRDTGFEFSYQGKWYSAQKGVITEIKGR